MVCPTAFLHHPHGLLLCIQRPGVYVSYSREKRKEKKRKEKKRKEKKRKEKKDYDFRRQFNEKPSSIPLRQVFVV